MRNRAGFSLVEILIVSLLTTVIMAAVYATLTVQQRSARQIGAMTNTQQTVRTSLQVIQSEMRELGSRWGDIVEAAPDHITFRAMRKVGYVCGVNANVNAPDIAILQDTLSSKDTLYIAADRKTMAVSDDQVVMARATINGSPINAACTGLAGANWPSMTVNTRGTTLTVLGGGADMTGVSQGAPVRTFKTITYGVYAKGSSYVLGRLDSTTDTALTLIGPLAAGGVVLSYYDLTNNLIPSGSLAANKQNIGRIRISVTGLTKGSTVPGGAYSDALSADVALRGN